MTYDRWDMEYMENERDRYLHHTQELMKVIEEMAVEYGGIMLCHKYAIDEARKSMGMKPWGSRQLQGSLGDVAEVPEGTAPDQPHGPELDQAEEQGLFLEEQVQPSQGGVICTGNPEKCTHSWDMHTKPEK